MLLRLSLNCLETQLRMNMVLKGFLPHTACLTRKNYTFSIIGMLKFVNFFTS